MRDVIAKCGDYNVGHIDGAPAEWHSKKSVQVLRKEEGQVLVDNDDRLRRVVDGLWSDLGPMVLVENRINNLRIMEWSGRQFHVWGGGVIAEVTGGVKVPVYNIVW